MKNNIYTYIPHTLLALYVVVFVWLGIAPYDRTTWWVENLPIVAIAVFLVIAYVRGTRFSNLSYVLMAVLIFWHTVGGHYTFERVPFDWFNNFFGFERNMYDRIGHFSVGFYAFPIIEYITRRGLVRSRAIRYLFPLFSIAFVAMGYELIEWAYAATQAPELGAAFLGSQGDIWDAQKDMLSDTLGAVCALALYACIPRKEDQKEIGLTS